MGRLTTHVLDTANGRPAAGVAVRLYRLDGARRQVESTATNADGRTERPLVEGAAFQDGQYEIEFDIGTYFRRSGEAEPPFLGTVTVRVNLTGAGNYHVPLLASPWSHSTYRGS
jgi:5-hydroxyisourate hydrolase